MAPKTFGLVQSGNGRFGNKKGRGSAGLNGSVNYRAGPSNQQQSTEATEEEKRLEIEQRNELDLVMGFGQYAEGLEKLGWLVNIHPVRKIYLRSDALLPKWILLMNTSLDTTDNRL